MKLQRLAAIALLGISLVGCEKISQFNKMYQNIEYMSLSSNNLIFEAWGVSNELRLQYRDEAIDVLDSIEGSCNSFFMSNTKCSEALIESTKFRKGWEDRLEDYHKEYRKVRHAREQEKREKDNKAALDYFRNR